LLLSSSMWSRVSPSEAETFRQYVCDIHGTKPSWTFWPLGQEAILGNSGEYAHACHGSLHYPTWPLDAADGDMSPPRQLPKGISWWITRCGAEEPCEIASAVCTRGLYKEPCIISGRVLRLRMEGRLHIWRVAVCSIKSWMAKNRWPTSLAVG
jgi:hypothetical protein